MSTEDIVTHKIRSELQENAANCLMEFQQASVMYAGYPGLQHKVDREARCLADANEAIELFDALLARIAELEEDSARLDWLEAQDLNDVAVGRHPDSGVGLNVGRGPVYSKTLRSAIDLARKEKGAQG